MSANLQEMDNVVSKGAAAPAPMVAGGAQIEDLGVLPQRTIVPTTIPPN
jgi:hypothetical protein